MLRDRRTHVACTFWLRVSGDAGRRLVAPARGQRHIFEEQAGYYDTGAKDQRRVEAPLDAHGEREPQGVEHLGQQIEGLRAHLRGDARDGRVVARSW